MGVVKWIRTTIYTFGFDENSAREWLAMLDLPTTTRLLYIFTYKH